MYGNEYSTDHVGVVWKDGADWLKNVNSRHAVSIFAEPRVQERPRPLHARQLAPYRFKLVGSDLWRERSVAVLLSEKRLRPQNRDGVLGTCTCT